MMNLKIGNDIIETKRIEKLYKRFSERFLDRVYTKKEIEYCESKGQSKYQSYAARFAAKEAVFKAISDMLENKFSVGWKDIEILNTEEGKPYVNHNGMEFIEHIDISMSHIKELAIATAVIITK